MTRTTQMSEAARWWVPVGLAGAGAATSVAIMFGSVLTSAAQPAWPPPDTGPAVAPERIASSPMVGDAPCFARRLHWSVALDGPVPTCLRSSQVAFGMYAATGWTDTHPHASVAAPEYSTHIGQFRWATAQ